MLELARHHIGLAGVNAQVGKDFPDKTFDWVNSSIVMQHIPPRRGYEILRKLWNILNPDGVICVHITIYHDGDDTEELITRFVAVQLRRRAGIQLYRHDETSVGSMSMYDYDLSRVFSVLNVSDGQRDTSRKDGPWRDAMESSFTHER